MSARSCIRGSFATLALVATGLPALAQQPCQTVPIVDDRCEDWAATYDNPAGYGTYGEDLARAIGVSDDGSVVYVAGTSRGKGTGLDALVTAYRASDGTQLWMRRLDAGSDEVPVTMAVAGANVYVAGWSGRDFLIVSLSNGGLTWSRRFDGSAELNDEFTEVALSPDGLTLYATGVEGWNSNLSQGDLVTFAFDSRDGNTLWSASYDGAGKGFDVGETIDVAPDGSAVFVSGRSRGTTTGDDIVTIALEAEDEEHLGETRWTSVFHGGNGNDHPVDAGLGSSGDRLFVVGSSRGGPGASMSNNMDILTLSVSTKDGGVDWSKRLNGPDNADDLGRALAVAPDGQRVFVTGLISDRTTSSDTIVAAYAVGDGTEAWSKRYNGLGYTADHPAGIAVSPDGTKVYATARSFLPRVSGGVQGVGLTTNNGTIATMSFAASDGAPGWTARHGSLVEANIDEPNAIAVDPTGARVFVAATYGYRLQAQVQGNYHDMATLAYLA